MSSVGWYSTLSRPLTLLLSSVVVQQRNMFGAGVEVLGLHQGNRALVVLCYSCGHVNIDVEVEKQVVQES